MHASHSQNLAEKRLCGQTLPDPTSSLEIQLARPRVKNGLRRPCWVEVPQAPLVVVLALFPLTAHLSGFIECFFLSFDQSELHPALEKEWRITVQPPLSNIAFVIARRQQDLSELAVAVINNRGVFGQLT
jgi:hypothetical protein